MAIVLGYKKESFSQGLQQETFEHRKELNLRYERLVQGGDFVLEFLKEYEDEVPPIDDIYTEMKIRKEKL